MTPEFLRDLLINDVVEVTFKKKNGDERVMFATLNENYLPENLTSNNEIQPFKDIITVWDIEAQGWRSFYFNSLTRVEYDPEDGNIVSVDL